LQLPRKVRRLPRGALEVSAGCWLVLMARGGSRCARRAAACLWSGNVQKAGRAGVVIQSRPRDRANRSGSCFPIASYRGTAHAAHAVARAWLLDGGGAICYAYVVR